MLDLALGRRLSVCVAEGSPVYLCITITLSLSVDRYGSVLPMIFADNHVLTTGTGLLFGQGLGTRLEQGQGLGLGTGTRARDSDWV